MWTPRRQLLLVIGFAVYFAGYLVYARSHLGVIDGLPALPEIYAHHGEHGPSDAPKIPGPKKVEELLRQAFAAGNDCDELNWRIKLELNTKGIILASEKFETTDDGRAMLEPVSLAIFPKGKTDGGYPEINTIRAKKAYLTFDKPVATVSEINGRKLTKAELVDDIMIVNNHRTKSRDDDLSIHINKGPVYFQEDKHLIWTEDSIYLRDEQSKPRPTEIRGTGMELELLTETPSKPGAPAQRKPKQDNVTGVKRIILKSQVDMYLYVDGNSSFPGASKTEAPVEKKPAGAEVPEKAKIHITAPRFQYDFGKEKECDQALFEVPAPNPALPASVPQRVEVTRTPPPTGPGESSQAGLPRDVLDCERLVLRLRRKQEQPPAKNGSAKTASAKPPPGATPDQGMEIETAHATGDHVTLTSDAEKLEAHCVDLLHNTRTGNSVLKGNPQMSATKDGNVLYANEFELQEETLPPDKANPEGKKYQRANAQGSGHIDLQDAATKKSNVHAFWNDRLVTSRDGAYDLLVLTGKARFVDDEHEQSLEAATLKLWLDGPANTADQNKKAPPPPKPQPSDKEAAGKPGSEMIGMGQGRRPHHLEALEDVLAKSRDLNIHDTSRLMVWFKDVPDELLGPVKSELKVETTTPPAAKPASAPAPTAAAPGIAAPAAPAVAAPPTTGQRREGLMPGFPTSDPDKNEPPRPIDLTARSVEAWVLRSESRSVLDKLRCKGGTGQREVHVMQEPAKPDEKGIDIVGDELNMTYHADGSELVVTGDIASLLMDKIYILGPEVNIDQRFNKAWVNGPGAMRMNSNTTFNGEKTAKEEPLTIHWDKSMLFNSTFAEFHEGIQADQGHSRFACQSLRVQFDRPISLKEGAKTNEKPARVEHLWCDQNVRIDEAVMENDKLVKWQELVCTVFTQDTLKSDEPPRPGQEQKETSEVNATGPGTVRIYQHGGADPLNQPAPEPGKPAPAPKPMPKGPAEEDKMKLTHVNFTNRMYGNSETNTAKFWGNVRVLDMPTDNPQKQLDMVALLDNMPKDALYLTCEQLTVLSRKVGVKTFQEMEAVKRVTVQTRDMTGRCDKLTFNEAKDQVVLHGTEAEPAHLFRQLTKGGQTQDITGRTIVYIRSTGEFSVDGGEYIHGNK